MGSLSAVTDKHRGTAALSHKGSVLAGGLHFFMETQRMTEYLQLFLPPLAPDTLTLCPPNLKTKQFKVSTWAGGNKGSPGKAEEDLAD